VEYYTCSTCNCEVPVSNRIIHSARCRKVTPSLESQPTAAVTDTVASAPPLPPSRQLGAQSGAQSGATTPAIPVARVVEYDSLPAVIPDPVIVDMTGASADDNHPSSSNPSTWTCETCTFINSGNARSCSVCEAPNPRLRRPASNSESELWDCPRCTMKNHRNSKQCTVCNAPNPADSSNPGAYADSDNVRAADPVTRSRLINDDDIDDYPPNMASGSWSGSLGSSCAPPNASSRPQTADVTRAMLFGALGGAGLAYLNDSDMMSSAMLGAAAGAMGANAFNSLNQQAGGGYPGSNPRSHGFSGTSSSGDAGNPRNFRSGRHAESNSADDFDSFITPFSRAASSRTSSSRGPQDELMQHIQRIMMQRPGQRRGQQPGMFFQMFGNGNAMDVDGMSYETLLERFSNPAVPTDERTLQALPTHVVGGVASGSNNRTPIDLSGDAASVGTDASKSCCVCLEPYVAGDEVKTLPCLHQFHCGCIDTWLRQSTVCPVCKYSLR
jgi:hypothetical protein